MAAAPLRPTLKKPLGQHHLVDGRLCLPLVSFLRPSGCRVLEVGPGGGVLTAELARAGARVWAWELDPAWAFALGRQEVADLRSDGDGEGTVSLVVGDALDIPWDRLPEPTLAAGNLPYGIATALIARLLRHPGRIPRSAFLVQKEVADRLVAGAGDPAYGALSVLVTARAEARILGRVRAGSFRPPPKVEGAFVGFIARRPPLPPERMERFEALVHQAFSQRRKTLRNSLGSAWRRRGGKERTGRVLDAAGIPPRARAEELGLADFLRLNQAAEEAGMLESISN